MRRRGSGARAAGDRLTASAGRESDIAMRTFRRSPSPSCWAARPRPRRRRRRPRRQRRRRPKRRRISPPRRKTDAAARSRFSFNRVDDGFLRLDNQTGQVAFCSPPAVGWACQAVPEDRAALEKEIARLQDEVASLKTGSRGACATPPPPPPRRPPICARARQKRRRRANCAGRSGARPRRLRERLAAAGRDDREFPEGHDAEGLAPRRCAECPVDFPPSPKSPRN